MTTIAKEKSHDAAGSVGSPQVSRLTELMIAFKIASKTLEEARRFANRRAEPPSGKPIRVLGGQTKPMTLILPDRTEPIAAMDWYFGSGEQILSKSQRELENAPASERSRIRQKYDHYWSEYSKQHQANKKFAARARKAEAAVIKAGRAKERALRAIVQHKACSPKEAVQLVEFVANEHKMIADATVLRAVVKNAAKTLRRAVGKFRHD